ncbi:hypothetical protein SmJEL517_g02358 [Synchytrium microbalum]|uniref:Methyltransferase type 11 domain-containing protein n=1 Tax=Synchytrium microbalum TaxID=1806994 RepID=A0A507CBB7_9FUNG|nr:uncharacterized protein SmJEL517_g02358 [Synchytrium microbalum]TPX35296.1 hypothetical protein SmJEL517_g02358 [Synchytrium microbalum]
MPLKVSTLGTVSATSWILILTAFFCGMLMSLPSLSLNPKDKCVSCPHLEDTGSTKEIAIKWRRIAGEVSCIHGGVGPTGGWCLNETVVGKEHVPACVAVSKAIVKYLGDAKPLTLLDIGAGVGQYGKWFESNNATNIMWRGYDGAENVETFTKGYVKWIDVTDALFDTIDIRADWVMSLEVAELIPPEATTQFLTMLDKHNREGIILSWAVPDEEGFNHINTKTNEDVFNMLAALGYIQNEWTQEFEKDVRGATRYPWFKNTFMVFLRAKPIRD